METEEQHLTKIITKPDDNLSLLDGSAALFPIQKIIFGILADKNKPMTPGQISSEYYAQLANNITMNWRISNAANQIGNLYMGSEGTAASSSASNGIKPIRDKPLDSLSLNLTSNDYSAKLEFVRKAAAWLLGKNSKGVILSASAIKNNLMLLPPVQSIKGNVSDAKFYYVDPIVLKEWRKERDAQLAKINENPFARFDEETLRLFNLSNYLLSLHLQEIEKISDKIKELFAVVSSPHNSNQLKAEWLANVNKSVYAFIDKLGLPKSVLNTSLLIQFYAVPLADKLDGAIFARHFTQ